MSCSMPSITAVRPGEREVEHVAALAGLEPHAAAGAQRDAVDLTVSGPGRSSSSQ